MPRTLAYKNELLQQIADGLAGLQRNTTLVSIEVVFRQATSEGYEDFEFCLRDALDAIANDLTWDERGDWRECNVAIVRSI